MEWRYKTVHYGVKKEGLLGGSFLDEEEMEISLNEYGEQGWELVSLLEVRDGVVAVFKQEKALFEGGVLGSISPDVKDSPVTCKRDTAAGYVDVPVDCIEEELVEKENILEGQPQEYVVPEAAIHRNEFQQLYDLTASSDVEALPEIKIE